MKGAFMKRAIVTSFALLIAFSVAAFVLKALTSYDFSTELGIIAAALSVENVATAAIKITKTKGGKDDG